MSSACTNQAVNKVYACARTRTRSFCYSKLVQKSEEGLRATQARAQRLSSPTAADRTSRNPDRRPVGSRTCKSGRSCPLLLLLHSEHRHHQRPQLRLLQRRRQRWAEHQCRAGSRTRRSFAERLLARRQRQQQNRTRRRRRGRSLRAGEELCSPRNRVVLVSQYWREISGTGSIIRTERTLFLRNDHEGLPVWRGKELSECGAEGTLSRDGPIARFCGRNLAHEAQVGLKEGRERAKRANQRKTVSPSQSNNKSS